MQPYYGALIPAQEWPVCFTQRSKGAKRTTEHGFKFLFLRLDITRYKIILGAVIPTQEGPVGFTQRSKGAKSN